MNEKILKKYTGLLPQHLNVSIKKTKMGLVAEIKEFTHCYTQASNFSELVEMVNDAVFTYLGIPEKYRRKLGMYLPEKAIAEFNRIKTQEAFRDLIRRPDVSKSVFSRVLLVPA